MLNIAEIIHPGGIDRYYKHSTIKVMRENEVHRT